MALRIVESTATAFSEPPCGSLDDDIISKRCKASRVTGVVRLQYPRGAKGMPEVPNGMGRRFVGRFDDDGEQPQLRIGTLPMIEAFPGVQFTVSGGGSDGKEWSSPSTDPAKAPLGFQMRRLKFAYFVDGVKYVEEARQYRYLLDHKDEKSAVPYFVLAFSPLNSAHRTLSLAVPVENQKADVTTPILGTALSSEEKSWSEMLKALERDDDHLSEGALKKPRLNI